MFDPVMRNAYVHDAVVAHFPEDTAMKITRCGAFEALAISLARTAGDDPAEMGAVLDRVTDTLSEDTMTWLATGAEAPAAFVQSRVVQSRTDHQEG